jgi:hypothetical protein
MAHKFIKFCEHGDLEGAKNLLQLYPDINISDGNEYIFRKVCLRGHLEIAKWLLSVKPDINISVQNDWAFRVACYNGKLEVAKWLLSVNRNINISANNDEAFRNACYCVHLKIAKWLQSLNPWLYVIEYDLNENYTGYKIRSKEEANWEKRKNALYLTHQEKTNVLYQLPIDIAKSVTLFV